METRSRGRENWADDTYVADWLDRQHDRTQERERQFAMVRSLVPREPGEEFRYLNIGCGDGWLDSFLLDRFPRAQAVLIDGSPLMLERAQERLKAHAGRVSTVQVDLASSDWTGAIPGPIDVAVSTIAIHNLRDPLRIRTLYAELFDLLSDGGFFVNLDYVRAATPALRDLARHAVSDPDASYVARSTSGGNPGTIDEQLVWLREAGFTATDCFWKEFNAALFGGFKGSVRIPA
jgi:trans-aconitate methyltransferase